MNDNKSQGKHIASVILYLNLSFLLGLIYFILIVTALSVGLGTFIIWIGLPLLIGTFAMIRGIGAIERSLARELLGVYIPEPRPRGGERGIWRQGLANLRDPLTWKCLLYTILKFPLGILSFVVSVTLLSITLALVLAPLGYLIATFVLQIIGIHPVNDGPAWVDLIAFRISGDFEALVFLKGFIYTGLGIASWFFSRSILKGLGWFSGELARALLSPVEWEMNMPNVSFTNNRHSSTHDNTPRYAQQSEHGYERGYEATQLVYRDDTQPRAVYQEQPYPTQEGPLQYQR